MVQPCAPGLPPAWLQLFLAGTAASRRFSHQSEQSLPREHPAHLGCC